MRKGASTLQKIPFVPQRIKLSKDITDITFKVLENPYVGEREIDAANNELAEIESEVGTNAEEQREGFAGISSPGDTYRRSNNDFWSIIKDLKKHKRSEILRKGIEVNANGIPTETGRDQFRSLINIFRLQSKPSDFGG